MGRLIFLEPKVFIPFSQLVFYGTAHVCIISKNEFSVDFY